LQDGIWINPLISAEKVRHYSFGEPSEIVYSSKIVFSGPQGVARPVHVEISRGFLLDLVDLLLSDPLAVKLAQESIPKETATSIAGSKNSAIDDEAFFKYVGWVCVVAPEIAGTDMRYFKQEIAVMARGVMESRDWTNINKSDSKP
jgi:hypothetical protein